MNLLGQGKGRVADGVALCAKDRFAVVFDAKVRRDGYRTGTEDRKFREYMEHHGEELRQRGIEKLYFCVVSSRFDDRDIERAKDTVRRVGGIARSLVLLEAAALVELVEQRLRHSSSDSWDGIERVFSDTRIVRSGDPFTVV